MLNEAGLFGCLVCQLKTQTSKSVRAKFHHPSIKTVVKIDDQITMSENHKKVSVNIASEASYV